MSALNGRTHAPCTHILGPLGDSTWDQGERRSFQGSSNTRPEDLEDPPNSRQPRGAAGGFRSKKGPRGVEVSDPWRYQKVLKLLGTED